MARPQSIHLRRLRRAEQLKLSRKVRDKTLPVRVYERYRVIAEGADGKDAASIADRVGVHLTTVYDWLHRFNAQGFQGIEDPPNPAGRPSSLSSNQIRTLIKVALSRPTDLGLPFSHWSVAKLKDYCRRQRLLPDFSDEWVRRLLRRQGVTVQRTKTWKESPDPGFEVKKT